MKQFKPLTETHPEIVKEWHPNKNSGLNPDNFSAGSRKRIWWKCNNGDDHEWFVSIGSRTANNSKCPICSGRKIVPSNSLQTMNPIIAREWDYEKNSPVMPYEITSASNKRFWWICTKNKSHIWKTSVKSRVKGSGCPYCSGHKIDSSNSLEVLFPDVIKEWDYERNGDLLPSQISAKSKIKVWWKCRNNQNHNWIRSVSNKIQWSSCPICKKENELKEKALFVSHPSLIKEWYYEKNGSINPTQITKTSKLEVWWICSENKKHIWKTKVLSRAINKSACPFCWQHKRKRHKNLAITNPELVAQWHPSLNKDLLPKDVSKGMSKKIWWKCDKGDDHIWQAQIISRIKGSGCPVCSNKKVVRSNCLAITNPELTKKWNYEKNKYITPYNVVERSHKKVWWKCEKGIDHIWEAAIYDRSKGKGCPICSGQKVVNSNSLSTLFPKIASEWHPHKNGNLTPNNVTAHSNKKVWWKCNKGDDHVWKTTISKRTSGYNCPICTGQKVVLSNSLAFLSPEISKSWHPTKNKSLTPEKIGDCSSKKIWWKCKKGLDHEWQATVAHRINGRGCSICAGKKVVKSNSLKTLYPEIAKEWHPIKNGKLTADNVSKGSYKKVWWRCQYDNNHVWMAIIGDRVSGNGCPFCKLIHRSKTELGISCELKTIFKGISIFGEKLNINNYIWDIDILIPELKLVIEYDGNYWHKEKEELDKRKSKLILKKGYNIFRIREEPLDKINEIDIIIKVKSDLKIITNATLTQIKSLYSVSLTTKIITSINQYIQSDTLMGLKYFNDAMKEINKSH